MKLMRIGNLGSEKPAILLDDGTIRDISSIVSDIAGDALGAKSLDKIRNSNLTSLPILDANERIGACVGNVSKFIGIGLNYSDHAEEMGLNIPPEPVIFTKATTCICGANDDIIMPPNSKKLDWEVELGIVIGTKGNYIREENALDHIAGYCVVNDISERVNQIEKAGQWVKGKSADTFGPIGPYLVTKDEVPNPQNLKLWLEVDGKKMQNGTTKTMAYGVKHLVHYVSQFMTLLPGDIITTGTPPGVGMGKKPEAIFLRAGQKMRLSVEGLGEQNQEIVSS
ncbi:MAG: fumarylacetoacetate hydrolase family protein [Devosiaceae bacterium]|nr:fumarylacetoacetate hydrolase family protein [Devosiaceae bacterium]